MEQENKQNIQPQHTVAEQPTRKKPFFAEYALPLAIVFAGIMISGSVLYGVAASGGLPFAKNTASLPAQAGAQPQTQTSADISKVKTAGRPFIGNPNAPVTIAYWFDHQCPFCRKAEEEVMPQLISDYVKTGKVKIVYKDFQFLGPDSQTIGQFARAVWDVAPDKFYDWHKAMYDNQGTENTGWATQAKIASITQGVLGASDTSKVQALVTQNKDTYQKEMDADKAEGSAMGVSGTPSMVIGKQLIVGAQPYSAYKSVLDLALKGK